MIHRSLTLTTLAVAVTLCASCGGSSPNVISKSAIQSSSSVVSKPSVRSAPALFSKKPTIVTPAASASSVAAASAKPRDKHSMPVYAFGDRNRVVRTTAYTCSEDDHLVYGSKNAIGTQLRYNDQVRSAAADWSFYPVGTTFRIKGLPYLYVIDDYGSALLGTGTVDIYTPSKDIMNQWGTRNVELTIVQWGSFNRSAGLLGQRTGYDHCRKMLANIVRQQPNLGNSTAKL